MYGKYLFEITEGFGPTLYGIMIAIGLLSCMLTFNILGKKVGLTAKSIEFYEYNAYASIAVGFGSAFLFQYVYDLIDGSNRGWGASTFIGGLIGGVTCFLLVTIFLGKPAVKAQFPRLMQVGVCCVLVAHAFGRIGCFFAGCCYGKSTDSFLGMVFPYGNSHGSVYPTMLYEAIFLFLMYAICVGVALRKQPYNHSIYLMGYGLFRFLLEYMRGDERGTLVPGISPSQFWSICFFLLGVAMLALQLLYMYRRDILNKLPKKLAFSGAKLCGAFTDVYVEKVAEPKKKSPVVSDDAATVASEPVKAEPQKKPEREAVTDEFED